MEKITSLPLNPTVPFSPFVTDYINFGGCGVVESYNGWKPETNSWKQTCYLSANLSGLMAVTTVKGPDALRMMNENFVNNFTPMAIGTGRHGIMVTVKGNIIEHGLVIRTSEDTFDTYAFQPYLSFVAERGKYDVTISARPMGDFIYQLAGPRSLEIVEQATREDLHDLKFMHTAQVQISGHPVRVIRMGMGGTLAYEVHGPVEASDSVYNALLEVGAPYGIEKLGWLAYQCNHTENGFPQIGQHFPYPFDEEEGFADFQKRIGFLFDPLMMPALGSLSSDMHDYYRNPFEVGWGHMVKFDHDFNGREALEKIAAGPHRRIVTLEWDPEDLADLGASAFDPNQPAYRQFVLPFDQKGNGFGNNQDQVLDPSGEPIGASMQPIYTDHYKKIISLGVLVPSHAHEGKEVVVLWGNPGEPQKRIRARVSRYPYLDLAENRNYNLASIPRYSGK